MRFTTATCRPPQRGHVPADSVINPTGDEGLDPMRHRADRVVVIEDGWITAIGAHDELMRTEGHYRRMAELKLGLDADTPRRLCAVGGGCRLAWRNTLARGIIPPHTGSEADP